MKMFKKNEFIKNGIISAQYKNITESFAPHRHEFFEFEYIISGEGEYTIDNKTYSLSSGKVFLMTPANFHSVTTAHTELINISFPCELNNMKVLFAIVMQKTLQEFCLNEKDSTLIAMLCDEVISGVERKDYSYAIEFLNCILRKLVNIAKFRMDDTLPYVQNSVLYILENFTSNDITLKKTADHIGLSPTYFSELFAQEMGVTFKKYLDNLRFGYAAKLLQFSSSTISEIYEKCGFTDYANFSRRFKERYKTSPSEYRKIIQSISL